jgi:putative transposase
VVAARPKQRHVYPAGETSRVAANVLNRAFDAARPDQKWVGEHTLLWTAAGWVYLAVALGLFSRKGVGWRLSGAPDARLILAALNQAATLRRIAPGSGLLFHFANTPATPTRTGWRRWASERMSRRGNGWDNAVMERFFRSLKTESISRDRCPAREEVGWAVNKCIHFYNTRRIHSAVGGMSPNQAEQRFLKQA